MSGHEIVTYERNGVNVEVHHSKGSDYAPNVSPEEMKEWCENWIKQRGKVEVDVISSVFEEKFEMRNITRFTLALEKLIEDGKIIVDKNWEEIIYTGEWETEQT